MLANLESNVKFQHFQLYSQIGNLSLKNAQNSVFYYVHSHLANLFSVAVPLLKRKHLLGYGIWGGFPTESTFNTRSLLPATPKRGCCLSNSVFDVKVVRLGISSMCKQPWHGQNSHTRIQKSALFYWIPFKRKSMVQLFNYSG